MRQIGKVFFQGLVAILPLALTISVLWWLGSTAEAVFGAVLKWLMPSDYYVPGLGVALGFGAIFVVGMILRAWWVRSLWAGIEGLFEHIPLVKSIYGSVKDLMTFFAEGESKRELNQVVLVRVGDPALQVLGFITSDDAKEVTGRSEEADKVAVYLPMSYQIGGFMVIVPRDAIDCVDLSVEDALRTVVTAGLSGKSTHLHA